MTDREWGLVESVQLLRLTRQQGVELLTGNSDDDFGTWSETHGAGEHFKVWAPPSSMGLEEVRSVFSAFINAAGDADFTSFDGAEMVRTAEDATTLPVIPTQDKEPHSFPATDLLAFYRTPRFLSVPKMMQGHDSWGIYLTTAGIESLARTAFRPAGLGDSDALVAAAFSLYGHDCLA